MSNLGGGGGWEDVDADPSPPAYVGPVNSEASHLVAHANIPLKLSPSRSYFVVSTAWMEALKGYARGTGPAPGKPDNSDIVEQAQPALLKRGLVRAGVGWDATRPPRCGAGERAGVIVID